MEVIDLDRRIADLCGLVDEVQAAVAGLEVGRCDVDQLATIKGVAGRMGTLSDVMKTDTARRADELRQADGNDVVDEVLNPDGRSSARDESIERDRGDVLDSLPGLDEATRSGELSARYADVVARAVAKLTPSVRDEFYDRHRHLDQLAARLSVTEFGREVARLVERLLADFGIERAERQRHRRRASTFTELDTGMWGLSGRWDPLTGHRLGDRITAEVNAIYRTRRDDPTDLRTRDQVTADAITNLICGTPTSHQSSGGGATVVIITDQQTATGGPHAASVHEYSDGVPVAFDTLAKVLADTDTDRLEAVVNEHGVVRSLSDLVLDHGRSKRCATPAQRLALRVMHRTCIFPGCDVPFDACEQHHVVEWEGRGGMTDLINLGPACSRHHHVLHAHDWKLRLDPDTRDLTITYPDGTTRTHPHTGLTPPNVNRPPPEHA